MLINKSFLLKLTKNEEYLIWILNLKIEFLWNSREIFPFENSRVWNFNFRLGSIHYHSCSFSREGFSTNNFKVSTYHFPDEQKKMGYFESKMGDFNPKMFFSTHFSTWLQLWHERTYTAFRFNRTKRLLEITRNSVVNFWHNEIGIWVVGRQVIH